MSPERDLVKPPVFVLDQTEKYGGTILHAWHIDVQGNAHCEFPISFSGGAMRIGRKPGEYRILTLSVEDTIETMRLFPSLHSRIGEVQALINHEVEVLGIEGEGRQREVRIRPLIATLAVETEIGPGSPDEFWPMGSKVLIRALADPISPFFVVTGPEGKLAYIRRANVQNGILVATVILRKAGLVPEGS